MIIGVLFWLLVAATVVGTVLDFAQGGTQRLIRGLKWKCLR